MSFPDALEEYGRRGETRIERTRLDDFRKEKCPREGALLSKGK